MPKATRASSADYDPEDVSQDNDDPETRGPKSAATLTVKPTRKKSAESGRRDTAVADKPKGGRQKRVSSAAKGKSAAPRKKAGREGDRADEGDGGQPAVAQQQAVPEQTVLKRKGNRIFSVGDAGGRGWNNVPALGDTVPSLHGYLPVGDNTSSPKRASGSGVE